jgi:hypothetical protein
MSQHLLFANCVPLILKFFNLNITSFIQSKNSNSDLDFPNCIIGIQPIIGADDLVHYYSYYLFCYFHYF